MLVETEHRFRVADFYRMADAGVFGENARVELLEGRIMDMEPIGPLHGGSVNRLNRLFSGLARGRWLVTAQNPLHLDQYSEPQPDLMLVRPRDDDYTTSHPGSEDVLLLVEVAKSSLDYDRGRKLPAYGRAGIPEVWIVNLENRILEIYRGPNYSGYDAKTVARVGEKMAPLAFPDAIINVSELLRVA